MKTLSDISLEGKVCLTRVDFNCPLDRDKNLLDTTRIKAHAETIQYIADHKGKVVVIAHQGRKGSDDFISLRLHSEALQRILGDNYTVGFSSKTHGLKVEDRISKMKDGEILLLENVRFLDEETKNKSPEEHSKDPFIQSLAKAGEIFVNDAFSAAHRSHASLVGFTPIMPSVAGLVMEREIKNLQRVVDNPKKPCTFILGGIKPEDSFKVADYVLSNDIADYVLFGGIISQISLIAKGFDLGTKTTEFLEKKKLLEFVKSASDLLRKFGDKIKLNEDFAVNENGRKIYTINDLPLQSSILDIGDKTIMEYSLIIENSLTCVLNGPMGKFEENGFEKGTVEIFKSMSRSKGFSLAGGGHSVSILEKHHIKLSYISTAGGAMIRFLMGKPLPAIQALNTKK
ncbi:MAG: phosphoglycerate kinase [Candidatus Hodarchaeales archaeon]